MYYFVISFKNSFVYRSGILFKVISSIFSIIIQIALWSFIYQNDKAMISYMISYVILANIIGMFYSGGMSGAIGGKVSGGSFANDLIKPTNFIGMNYFSLLGGMASSFILRGIPIIVVFSPALIMNISIQEPLSIVISIMAIILGHFLYIILYSLIGFLAFIFIEIWPLERLMNDTIRILSGAFIPLSLFPGWLKTISNYLPFRFLYSFPLEIILNGNKDYNEILQKFSIMIAWILALGVLLLLTYKKAINKCVVQGG